MINIERQAWSNEAAQGLGETLSDCEDLLREQVERGIAELWRVDDHSWMITRTEHLPNRKPELVVCCYKGREINAVTQVIMEAAKQQGFGSIRYHTNRKGLNRLVQDLGFEYMETIYLKQLDTETEA